MKTNTTESKEKVAGHTPGPWHAGTAFEKETAAGTFFESWIHANTNEDGIATSIDRDQNQAEANARLIAAAPELLEALKALLEQRELQGLVRGDLFRACEVAEAAIAKAEGRG